MNLTYESVTILMRYYIFSEYINAYIVWVSSYEQLSRTVTAIRNILAIYSAVLLFLLTSISMYIINKTSKPVDELLNYIANKFRSKRKNVNVYGITRDIIEETFDNYSKLQLKMERMLPVFRERLLYSLMTRNDLSRDEISRRLEEHDIHFRYKWFYVLSVEIFNLYKADENEKNPNLKRLAVHEVIDNYLSGGGMTAYKVDIDDERLAVVLNTSEQDIEKSRSNIKVLMNAACRLLKDKYDVDAAVGVSERSDSIFNISMLYKNSINALNYRLIDSAENVVFIDLTDHKPMLFDEFDPYFEEKLTNIILAGDPDRALNVMTDIFKRYKNEKETTALCFQNGSLYLLIILAKIASKTNYDSCDLFNNSKNLVQVINGFKTVGDAEAFFINAVRSMCGYYARIAESNQERYYKEIMDYIDRNYTEDISIDSASQAIGISSSYIFQILREKGQMTFTEYIARKRVKKACELLQEGYKIQDIAFKVGYSSATYFIQVFKKLMGCTPSDYKNLNC